MSSLDTECFGEDHNKLKQCDECTVFNSCKRIYLQETKLCKSPKCENRFKTDYGNEQYCNQCREEAKMVKKKEEMKKPIKGIELSYYMILTGQRDDIRRAIKEKREAESKVKSTAQKISKGYDNMLDMIDNMEKEKAKINNKNGLKVEIVK